MRALRLLAVTAAFVAGLFFVAWWTVPIVAAASAALSRDKTAPGDATVGAFVASLLLLAPRMLFPAFGTLLRQLGQVFPMPGIAVMLLGVVLTMILAFTSARVMLGVVGTRTGVSASTRAPAS